MSFAFLRRSVPGELSLRADLLEARVTGTWSDVDPLVRYFCCDSQGSQFGPFTAVQVPGDGLDKTVLIPGKLWRYRVTDELDQPVDLHVCAGLGDGGGLLWGLEARALLQLGARNVPGLPELLDGGYVRAEQTAQIMEGVNGLGIIAARAADYNLADDGAMAFMADNPHRAIRVFTRLAEGLSELHAQGMVHGSLWPGAIYVASTGPDQSDPNCWLAHFEMAALLANYNRLSHNDLSTSQLPYQAAPDTPNSEDIVRYAAPEAQGGTAAMLEPRSVARADIYSLAAIAVEWLAGRPSETRAGAPGWAAQLHSGASRVPASLAGLLLDMLGAPQSRPDATEVVRRLRDSEHSIAASWGTPSARHPHLLFYLPTPTGRMLARWGLLDTSPDTAEGRREIGSLLAADLRGGQLLYSPQGAAPFVVGEQAATGAAQYVLLGSRAAWFCAPYREQTFGQLGQPRDDALIVKHCVLLSSTRLEQLRRSSLRAELPAIEAVPADIALPLKAATLADRPSWVRLLDALNPRTSTDDALFDEAIAWLLTYQAAALNARCYACTPIDTEKHVAVRTDEERDRAWLYQHPLLLQYASTPPLRPHLGDFFAELDADQPTIIQLMGDLNGRPAPSEYHSLWFVDGTGPDWVTLRPARPGNEPPPQRCWIRPADDRMTAGQLRSQTLASQDLKELALLRSQLRDPRSRRTGNHQWRSAIAHTAGRSAAVLEEMLTFSPLYVLQGPPGTGKTTITAKAVAAWLRAAPDGRVLVSAQSTYALDTIAERILTELGELNADSRPTGRNATLALRPTSVHGREPSPAITPWTGDKLAERTARQTRVNVAAALTTPVEPGLRSVLKRWRDVLDGPDFMTELADRLARSANLVFATCAMARPSVVSPHRERDLFDWVVIEEAARAWPTELALPLTRAARWTLIGDHHQLPAHGRDQVGRFLDSLADHPHSDLAVPADRRAAYLRVFDLFRNLFEIESAPAFGERPVRRLTVQYRMAEPISRLVGEVFYPAPPDGNRPRSGLFDGGPRRTHSLTAPTALVGQPLVWIDTHGRPDCRDEPAWANPGEATLVARLVELMTPQPAPAASVAEPESLMVLTPYRQQLQLLLRQRAVAGRAATVHSFQGREAEMVIVSLVRDTQRGPEESNHDHPWLSLGHLSQPQLVNVLLSRARGLLVLVGDFQHFARFTETSWGQVCLAVREHGVVVSADELFPSEEP